VRTVDREARGTVGYGQIEQVMLKLGVFRFVGSESTETKIQILKSQSAK
jgi:hypothetical protein